MGRAAGAASGARATSAAALAAAETVLESAKTVHEDAVNAHKEALGCKKNADAAVAAATKKLRDFDKHVKQWNAELATAENCLTDFQNGPLVAFDELSSDAVEEAPKSEEEAPKSEAEAVEEPSKSEAGEESAEAVDDSAPVATEPTAQENAPAPMAVDCPVASDKIVSMEPVNTAALSPQAGA